ncbi:MAG: NAD(P)H-dependent oxidoreductase [Flavobacterium sp.]|uniref:NAD(P)H-dependent oxidoreductase n=1 Tax=Flavobacterium sp. TaxID=239 RepID=UPI000C351BAD|nr:NAD(P)H-dependent oxidoreductase [Flavobacterium sp.]MBF03629.1 NAD(P)H-dependent oxidoreductase [Flavobacterium sp.]|tara:strand:+ start:106 stop:738 length:633 start_codon:yes stop_codon:yes gene_type:complete
MSTFIENQKWRYATKKFDATKKIATKDLETLKEAIQLSTSSYGLQPYKVLIIENPELRAKLQPASWGQTQIVDASHLLVFANSVDVTENEIDNYMANIANTRGLQIEDLKPYSDFMKSKLIPLPAETKAIWTSKQTYLALGNLLNAAAELKIDVTPMEGFEPEKYNEILGLNALGLNASLVATLGYRHEEDTTQHYAKVRKPNEELFITL